METSPIQLPRSQRRRRSSFLRSSLRRRLLYSASVFALVVALSQSPVKAQTLSALRGAQAVSNTAIMQRFPTGSPSDQPGMTGSQNGSSSQRMSGASIRSLQYQVRVTQAINMSADAQAAARAAAASSEPNVPDGLAPGGLVPVPDPVTSANDTTGLHTWDGADQPTQTTGTDGTVNVTVHQTQSRAILSWETFNVGKKTDLTFDQSVNGVDQQSWVALNRVVGQLDPVTGLRDPNAVPAPSEILGSIHAPGTVLVLNQNGVIFGGTSQINTFSLIATSLEVGRALDSVTGRLNIKQRNDEFLAFGFLGYADQASQDNQATAYTFSAQENLTGTGLDPLLEGAVNVQAGAQITSGTGGYILLTGPKVINSGTLSSVAGQVSLQSGRDLKLTRSTGSSDTNPDVRGFTLSASMGGDTIDKDYVFNTENAVINSAQGYLSLGATDSGAVLNDGFLGATTSVSRNGFIQITGADIQIGTGATVAITPDDGTATIPQDPRSIADFRASKISIGSDASRIEVDQNAMIYAPGGNVDLGALPGLTAITDGSNPGDSRIFVDNGAIIDVAGLTDVLIPASRNQILIDPVKGNELRDDPNYRHSFLNGALVLVDPRLSGVDENGVAWVGSPLIEAESFAEQVGVKVQELMTAGGSVTLGVQSYQPGTDATLAPDITVKSGATIDFSGGWVTYQGGYVQTSQLIARNGELFDIGIADINGDYVGINSGFVRQQPRWGVTEVWGSPLLQGGHYEGTYTEGRDAGSLTLKGSAVVFDGDLFGEAYAGPLQVSNANLGTAASSVYGDYRSLQGAPSQMPTGGFLFVQGLSGAPSSNTQLAGGGDIDVVSQANYHPVDSSLTYGQSAYIDSNGNLVIPTRDPNSLLPTERQQTISLSAYALSSAGLSSVSLETTGKISIESDANVALDPGGRFDAVAGRAITVDGSVSAPSGVIQLQTVNAGQGSVFLPDDPKAGSYDITVNGTLSTRGRWVNDEGADADHTQGSAYTDGGSVVLIAAPRQTLYGQTDQLDGDEPEVNVDISGSILLNSTSVIDVSSGGYVTNQGQLDLTAHGGNVSLIEETTYFQLAQDVEDTPGGIPGFRVSDIVRGSSKFVPVNPDSITAKVTLDGTILAAGFGGGGTFTLVTPEIQFGDGTAETGTEMNLDFFSTTGFGNFNISSYKTDFIPNDFDNGLGGFNAVLATQTLTIGDGQTLNLTESMFSPIVSPDQMTALQNLGTDGDLYSVLKPGVPTDAWDARPVNLTLGGLVELDVAQGGSVIGAAGSGLAASKILNEGNIRIAGGTITQSEALPALYADDTKTIAVQDLSQVFSVNADGTIHEDDPNAYGITQNGALLSNAEVASEYGIYLLGKLGADDGIVLAAGSVTDLSGTSIVNPRPTVQIPGFRDGRVIDGGTIQTVAGFATGNDVFRQPFGQSVYYGQEDPQSIIVPEKFTASPGSLLDISGASDTFDRLDSDAKYEPTLAWSNGGTLEMANGGTLTGATIKADGGAPHALGGTLIVGVGTERNGDGVPQDVDLTLYQDDPTQPTFNAVSATMIENSGFDTLVAQGGLTSVGDVDLSLGRALFVVSKTWDGQQDLSNTATRDTYAPVISSGGVLEVDAPYIRLESALQNVSTPLVGMVGDNSVIFRADEIDVSGAVLFDQSVSNVELFATNDVRLSGVEPWQRVFNVDPESVDQSLAGQLAVNGNLTITSGQVFPTTGSTFYITSAAADGTITFARSGAPEPATPYSAGGNLLVQAATIEQGGDIRVPVGSLTLGASDPFQITTDGTAVTFAPGTQTVDVLPGSTTSVSADGMVIPYGITTDQIEWFFAATGADELKAPPQAILTMGGANVKIESGATVDVSGGGDLYAYEFISGIGGSHDVLDRLNDDEFSSNNGFQYPDGRQVYAIVPSLGHVEPSAFGSGQAALYDPIYSAEYSDLYSAQAAGKQVYLDNVPGLAAGWYTLLPAKYATLPGGLRVVENVGATNVIPGLLSTEKDGSYIVSGYYGFAGTGDYESTVRSFTVQTQSVFDQYSNIALTSANAKFANDAAHDGNDAPPLPVDAGRLVLAPSDTLEIDAKLKTDPGAGGRGAEVDISGAAFEIVSDSSVVVPQGTIELTADELTNLNAASLLIGGTRTDNADGTTDLHITSDSIIIANDAAHPLSAPELVFAVDGSGAGITVADGATIVASGTATNVRTGDYIIDGDSGMTGQGAVLRVSSGPQRQVTRENIQNGTDGGLLTIGAADIEGNAILLDSSGDLTAAPGLTLKTEDLALGAGQVTFTQDGSDDSGLVITPELQALISQIDNVTIRTPNAIEFSSGTYAFENLTLDTPGLELKDGSTVELDANKLTLGNTGKTADACDSAGAPLCGDGTLTLATSEIDFASGTLRTFGFGGGVSLSASTGIFAQGDATLDVAGAALDIATPFIGDRVFPVDPGETQTMASLSLVSTGAVTIGNPGGAAAGTFDGAPGATISINGGSVDISGTTIRATAGTLDIESATDITVGDGAVLSTPGYEKNFGGDTDPFIVDAPGGLVHLTADDGNIDLEAGSLVSVGGGTGTAGTAEFTAAKGDVTFDGMLDAQASNGGGSFILDQEGSFDLSAFAEKFGSEFGGTVAVRTATGDLALNAGDTLKAGNVMVTADGGAVDLFGTIDVSGQFGGDVSLYGLDGVTLHDGSLIDAHADGFGPTDTRQSRGGNVEIGTDADGIITVDNGAVIDVSAKQTADRLVPVVHNGTTYDLYVAGDVGGTVDFRAPIIEQDSGDDVNVFYNGGDGTIVGASQVVVQAFKRFDLAAIASDPDFVGVTINDQGQAVLNVGATGDGKLNWLADNGDGTLVQFIQDFDISAADSHLGALTSMDTFHERPGMELDYSGDIVLSSNWNLGAGVVDVQGAVAAGLMAELPTVAGKYYVLPGKEAEVFQDFTTLTYRTDHGSVDGEPGILTIRAGGTLDIKGSITDGFFQFHDQDDPDYLNMALGGGDKLYTPFLATGCALGDCSNVGQWEMVDDLPKYFVSIVVPDKDSLGSALFDPAPYSAAANAPDAAGALAGGTGDPLGSAQLFPLLTRADGTKQAVDSFSYQLVGGADLTGSALGTPSVDPMRTVPGATGGVIVEGQTSYTYQGSTLDSSSSFGDHLFLSVGGNLVTPEDWYDAFLAANPGSGLNADSYTYINFGGAPSDFASFLLSQIPTFFVDHPDDFQIITQGNKTLGVTTGLELAAQFMSDVVASNFSTFKGDYKPPKPSVYKKPTTATTRTLVRTGTGNIQLAAAGDIDLTNGSQVDENGLQLGGTSVYTAGHSVDTTPFSFVDPTTGQTVEINPANFDQSVDFINDPPVDGYRYGAGDNPGTSGVGVAGVLIADPIFAEGGGDVTLTAGRDVKGSRDVAFEELMQTYFDRLRSYGYDWIGTPDQAWRMGSIGNASVVWINPQLFQEGIGALGGGDISIHAGRDVSDISVVDDTSLTTANVTTSDSTVGTLGLWTFGGGNVSVDAGRDILGGRFDIASGVGNINAGRNITSAGVIQTGDGNTQDNELRLRLTDAFVSVEAKGDIDIQGIAALGVGGTSDDVNANLDSHGFYSETAGVSLLADGSVAIDNIGNDVLTESDGATENTAAAVYPGTLEATALNGNLDINTSGGSHAGSAFLMPSPTGELQLVSGADILPVTIAQDDGDLGLLPGIFTIFNADQTGVKSGRSFIFPGVLPNTSEVERQQLHNQDITHLDDPVPNRIYSGGDIVDMILDVAKQTRVGAARDIVNMMFFGQNVNADDVTRIVAGRDITATTELVEPVIGTNQFGEPEAAVQGNDFVIGGPGAFFLEAGRDAGPFLNSAVTNGFSSSINGDVQTGMLIYAGGIQSVGNDWNPWLDPTGANLYVEFGVGKGQNFNGLRDYYLDPANEAGWAGYLFNQVLDGNGNTVPDRNQPIYAPILISWLQNHQAALLQQLYGTQDISFQQAYDAFVTLPGLTQRVFLLGYVYFNELIETSLPDGPSFEQYSRGYNAVNLLFPSDYGYTKNDLDGGSNGANELVETGDLDLRLATIQTTRGGNVYILGPGGRVLAGSTVRTSEQAARRTYDGGRLFTGNTTFGPLPAAITEIPTGYEGILTLRGGSIYTFTDSDFLLNQSRLFTEAGGDIAMWSSNGDLNAGQGPKTSANFPPVVVQVDDDLVSQVDSVGGVTGAGIAAFQPADGEPAPTVYLIAPRGTVDAGDAGVRVAGNLFIAALTVANAENFSVSGTSSGIPNEGAVDVAAQTSGSSSAAAAEQEAQSLAGQRTNQGALSVVTVELLGVDDEGDDQSGDDEKRKKKKRQSGT